MKVYLKKLKNDEIINEYDNVIKYRINFVEYLNQGFRAKKYCDSETEYFSE